MANTIIRIDAAPTRVDVTSAPVRIDLSAAQGPGGPPGVAGPNSVTSTTTSNGTANLSLSNVSTTTLTITGMSVAPTASTTTSTTQLATTAFVQQELASGVAVAKNLEFLAHNGSGATIAKGTIVYINGAVGGIPRVVKAQANNDTNSARTIGFAKADIANGANGFVISQGELENVRTADADGIIGAGIQIYLSPTTPGAFTRTKPSAPQHLVYVGVVVTASTGVAFDGKILVGIQNGYELDELHDVAISSPAAKQVVKRNAGNTLWVNEAIVSADVSDATSTATGNTLVLRSATGGASFSGLNTNSGSYAQIGGANFNVATTASANLTATGSGTVIVSGAGGTTISGGALTISASSATFATGSIATSQPLTLTQTWTNAAVTYTGLQVNVTDTASNAASLLMDLRVGGASRFSVRKSGFITATAGGQIGSFNISTQIRQENSFIILNNGGLFMRDTNVLRWSATANAEGGTYDLYLQRDAANTLAQRNGNAAQESRIYGTYTGAGDYRRLALKMSSAGVAQIVAEGLGSGAADNRLEFVTGGATRMTVAADGNITTSGSITANSGLAVTSTSYPVLDVTRSTAATGDFRAATRFKRQNSSGTTSAGMGIGCFFEIPNAANNLKNVGFFGGAIATATAGAEVGELVFAPAWQGVDPYLRRDMVLRATGAATADLSLAGNLTASGDIEVTDSTKGIILKSPNGTRYRVTISDLGILSAASL
jgi:hypothetical protein